MEQLYSLGTVVNLENSRTEVMIAGYYSTDLETGARYTYLGISADVGWSLCADTLLFNHDKVAKVVRGGCADAQEADYRKRLLESAERGKL